MTLKEKFKDIIDDAITYQQQEDSFVQIADDFAVGFVEWFADNTLRVGLDGYKTFGDTNEIKTHTIKEILEIYKKEKRL